MAVRSKDPLTAATTAIFLPRLRAFGFQRNTNRIVGRIRANILQFFILQLSAYGGKDFCINYASLSLFCPRDYLILQPGARLAWSNGAEAWLSALTHDTADASMGQFAEMALEQALPFFESTKTVEGLLTHLQHEDWGAQHHLNLEKACCAAKVKRLSDARIYTLIAIELYREDGWDWCMQYIKLCEPLLTAIDDNTVGDLMERWTKQSITKLRLNKLLQGTAGETGESTDHCGRSC